MLRRSQATSEDHRGTPEDPGRVVTLIARDHWESLTDQHAQAPPTVWGAAYRIAAKDAAEMREYLDIREINGYSMQYTPFHVSGKATTPTGSSDISAQDTALAGAIHCLVYIGLPDNPQFLGPQDPQALAEKIVRSRGPSGENVEYLLGLEKALNGLSTDSGDEHVSDLASRCRKILASEGVTSIGVDHIPRTDNREETEK
ncbi:hypothetical protein AMS68_001666 [Peltaster fructicola]|uniref:glutathione-specific gamma-glutamylcyclotransferase n=1 Tax=Peltaster fructicola TaxID=286661 RepID=A0A6H0XNE4_9PEZI|nr:hypothetical protein AMS68_001666 [Peltaster fructicola]